MTLLVDDAYSKDGGFTAVVGIWFELIMSLIRKFSFDWIGGKASYVGK